MCKPSDRFVERERPRGKGPGPSVGGMIDFWANPEPEDATMVSDVQLRIYPRKSGNTCFNRMNASGRGISFT